MLVDFTEMSTREADAVAKLMKVYAENFAGESFHIAKNETSGCVYIGFDNVPVCPFVNGSGDLFFEVFDFESGDVQEFETLEEAEDHAAELQRIQMEEMED
jgi:hypothetical protein